MANFVGPTCDTGMCVTAADIGVGVTNHVAYAHPLCPEHGTQHQYIEEGVHVLHEGPMGVCQCGAYKDEHTIFAGDEA